jgi:galactosylceramidase
LLPPPPPPPLLPTDEFWLMAEAKKRNPQVRTYVLSWGVPGWVGNGTYFSPANIEYQTAFVKGARDVYNISVDYLGIWNERPWGNVEYVMSLRKSLDAAGLTSTQLVGSDGGIPGDQIKALQSDPAFAAAEHIQGTHYPCARDQPPQFWEITPKQTYWANEDFSTIGGDWAGGSCWGRSLNQNFVKLNATATISWSTIWSVCEWRPDQPTASVPLPRVLVGLSALVIRR